MGRILNARTDFKDLNKAESYAVNNWYFFLIGGFLVSVVAIACTGFNFFSKTKKVNELKEGMAAAKKKVGKHPVGKKLPKKLKDQAVKLANFFPTVSMDEIIEVSQKDMTHVEMIEELLAKGYPMKRTFFIGKVDKTIKVKDKGQPSGSKDKSQPSASKDKGQPSGSKDKRHPSGSKDKGPSNGSKDKGSGSKDKGHSNGSKDKGKHSGSNDKGHSSGSNDKGKYSDSKEKGLSSGSKDKGQSSGSKDKVHASGSKDKGHHSPGKKGKSKGGK